MSTPDNIIIDDGDPSIVYEGGKWMTDTSPINYTASGRPFNNTAHITYEQASFTITFQGDGIELWGLSSSPAVWSGNSGGEAIDSGSTSFGGGPEPGQQPMFRFSVGYNPTSWALSSPNTLKMTVNGSVDNPVAFDFARITPSGSVNPQDIGAGILEYAVSDAFLYGSVPQGWTNYDSLSTSTPDAPYVFNFTGTSIAGLGGNGVNDSHIQAIASYSIDGNAPINFTVNNVATSILDTITEQIIFQTNQYPLGNHSLRLVYHGDNTTTPLSLASLLVTSADTSLSVDPAPPSQPSMSTLSTSSTNNSPTAVTSPPATHAKSHKTTIAITVSVSIILIVILFCVAGFLLYRRRLRRFESKRYSTFSLDPGPVAMAIVPFTDNVISSSKQSDTAGGSFEFGETINHVGRRRMDDIVPSTSQLEALASPADGVNHHILVTRVHEDSGVLPRQPSSGQIMVVDLPPSYTSLNAESQRANNRRGTKAIADVSDAI